MVCCVGNAPLPSLSRSVRVPKFIRAKAQEPNAAGTVAGRKPSPGMGSTLARRNQSMVQARPLQPWPLMATTWFLAAL